MCDVEEERGKISAAGDSSSCKGGHRNGVIRPWVEEAYMSSEFGSHIRSNGGFF